MNAKASVAVLFAMEDSVYFRFPECDVWPASRNAMLYDGVLPIIAHPPCQGWGRLRAFAKPVPGEAEFARFAVKMIRSHGGVLEHPESSTLWCDMELPIAKQTADEFGGWTLVVDQHWWGDRARKRTWLYICGCPRNKIPRIPLDLNIPGCAINSSRADRPHVSKRERMATPYRFARFLIDLALMTRRKHASA